MKFDKLEKFLVPVWGFLWIATITCASIGAVIWCGKWVLSLLGVL